jgi:hypothetical protein
MRTGTKDELQGKEDDKANMLQFAPITVSTLLTHTALVLA